MKWCGFIPLFALACNAVAAEPKYINDFEKAKLDSLPEEFLLLDGGFVVKQEGGNKFLELPGAPLDTFGVLFGPTLKEDGVVTARIFGEAKGRRYPTFDVGLNGVGGYRLRVSPGKKQLELLRNDVVKKSVPLDWKPGKWTFLRLAVTKRNDQWEITGKVWPEGTDEPKDPAIVATDSEDLPAGRAGLFASPYSGTPVRFDDLTVSSTK